MFSCWLQEKELDILSVQYIRPGRDCSFEIVTQTSTHIFVSISQRSMLDTLDLRFYIFQQYDAGAFILLCSFDSVFSGFLYFAKHSAFVYVWYFVLLC